MNIQLLKKNSTLLIFFLAVNIASAQFPFKPLQKEILLQYIKTAESHDEVNSSQLDKFSSEYDEVIKSSKDANVVYDYGRILTVLLQPGLSKIASKVELSEDAKKIISDAEKAYRYAISNCECHGRANIMLGLLYNQQGKYFISESYLEEGLKLEKGSDDWMIAANQYLLAGAYTYNTDNEKYIAVYNSFKKFTPTIVKDKAYYQKMAKLYVSYYEK